MFIVSNFSAMTDYGYELRYKATVIGSYDEMKQAEIVLNFAFCIDFF